ncbi:hypothetical protein Tco_0408117 [Tanacetum coccineum]
MTSDVVARDELRGCRVYFALLRSSFVLFYSVLLRSGDDHCFCCLFFSYPRALRFVSDRLLIYSLHLSLVVDLPLPIALHPNAKSVSAVSILHLFAFVAASRCVRRSASRALFGDDAGNGLPSERRSLTAYGMETVVKFSAVPEIFLDRHARRGLRGSLHTILEAIDLTQIAMRLEVVRSLHDTVGCKAPSLGKFIGDAIYGRIGYST